MGIIRIGTASFSDPEWKDGVVYPAGMKPLEILPYYERELKFNCVEVDASYYAIMGRKTIESMLGRTGDDFIFTVKGYKGFCFDPFSPYEKSKPSADRVKSDLKKFADSMQVFNLSGRLGCVLLQFPVFFYPSPESFKHLEMCASYLREFSPVVEFRNIAWAKKEIYAFLKKTGLGFCMVDEPKVPRLMPFANEVTSDCGYFRLHGRNKDWFQLSKEERVNYKYSDEELRSFIPEIKKAAKKTKMFFVIFNNNYKGYAVFDAQRLRRMMDEEDEG